MRGIDAPCVEHKVLRVAAQVQVDGHASTMSEPDVEYEAHTVRKVSTLGDASKAKHDLTEEGVVVEHGLHVAPITPCTELVPYLHANKSYYTK